MAGAGIGDFETRPSGEEARPQSLSTELVGEGPWRI